MRCGGRSWPSTATIGGRCLPGMESWMSSAAHARLQHTRVTRQANLLLRDPRSTILLTWIGSGESASRFELKRFGIVSRAPFWKVVYEVGSW